MPAPKINFNTPEKYWDDAAVGDECTSPAYEVTAARIDAYAELTGDFTPVHVDEEYARQSHFGQRVAHGLMGLSVADGLKTQSEYRFLPGMSLGWTWDFLLPIYIGDVLRVRFKIGSLRESKSKPGWGIVVLPSELLNRLGLGYEELSKRNERLVYCSVSAFGHTGPDAQRPGFGLIAEARSGAQSLLGMPGEAPTLFRMPIADMYAGMHGVAAICAALFGRVSSGRGQHIDIALHDCMVSMHDYAAQGYLIEGSLPKQTGHDLPTSTVYGTFTAKDGYLVIAAQMADTWRALAKLMGGDEYAARVGAWTPTERNAHREEILARVRAWCLAQTSVQHCCDQLDAAGLGYSEADIDALVKDGVLYAEDAVRDLPGRG